jgi:hypothetical protein
MAAVIDAVKEGEGAATKAQDDGGGGGREGGGWREGADFDLKDTSQTLELQGSALEVANEDSIAAIEDAKRKAEDMKAGHVLAMSRRHEEAEVELWRALAADSQTRVWERAVQKDRSAAEEDSVLKRKAEEEASRKKQEEDAVARKEADVEALLKRNAQEQALLRKNVEEDALVRKKEKEDASQKQQEEDEEVPVARQNAAAEATQEVEGEVKGAVGREEKVEQEEEAEREHHVIASCGDEKMKLVRPLMYKGIDN